MSKLSKRLDRVLRSMDRDLNDPEFAPMRKAYDKVCKNGKPGVFYRDWNEFCEIVSNVIDYCNVNDCETMPECYQIALCKLYHVTYHDSGKIEGCYSFDSSCTGCNFCKGMRKNANGDKICNTDYDPELICNYCYDYEQEHNSFKSANTLARHYLNMQIMALYEYCESALLAIPGLPLVGIVRFNSSGDLQNVIMAKNYIMIAMLLFRCTCALWAKNVYAADCAFDEMGKPGNMAFVQSVCGINGKAFYVSPYADNTFTVYDNENSVQIALANESSECNGKKCRECGYKCYFKTHMFFNVAELLRIKKSK